MEQLIFFNSGSFNNAIFDTIITNWGGIDVEQSFISTGFSNPTLYDSSGVYQLFLVLPDPFTTFQILIIILMVNLIL